MGNDPNPLRNLATPPKASREHLWQAVTARPDPASQLSVGTGVRVRGLLVAGKKEFFATGYLGGDFLMQLLYDDPAEPGYQQLGKLLVCTANLDTTPVGYTIDCVPPHKISSAFVSVQLIAFKGKLATSGGGIPIVTGASAPFDLVPGHTYSDVVVEADALIIH